MTQTEALNNIVKYMQLKEDEHDKAVLVADSIYKLRQSIKEMKK